jgi:HAD superfamily hydrolase (TIGR01509 family)
VERLRGVILDVDGTLVDSNDAHARSWTDTFARFGYDVSFDEVRRRIGEGGDKLLFQLIGVERDSPLGTQISHARKERFAQAWLPTLRPFPRARDLLLRMRAAGLRLVVATSSERDELARLLAIADVRDLIESEVSSSDAERSKPDSDLVHAALDRLQLPAAQVVMLGDTPYDVEAARRAGVATVALRSGGWNRELDGAIAIYDDPADLLASFDDSPLARTAHAAEQPGAGA